MDKASFWLSIKFSFVQNDVVLTFHKNGFYFTSVFPSILQGNTKILVDRPKDKILVTCIIYLFTLNFLRYSVITLHFEKVNGNM